MPYRSAGRYVPASGWYPGRRALADRSGVPVINTIDIEEGREQLAGPEQLLAWLSAHGLAASDSCIDQRDVAAALELREALRELAAANSGTHVAARVVATLNHAAAGRLGVHFEQDGTTRLQPADDGWAGAAAGLLALVHSAMLDGTWPRLKVRHNDACRWVFYDRSRNSSGTWCSMQICGNRLKARAYRERQTQRSANKRE